MAESVPLQIPPHFSSASSPSHMAAVDLCKCKCGGKENDPTPPTTQTPIPVQPLSSSSTKTIRRRLRKPLADITNLVGSIDPQSASDSHGGFHLPRSVSVSVPNSRKRKAVGGGDSLQATLFKTMRRDFR